jgi:hypothetical protein
MRSNGALYFEIARAPVEDLLKCFFIGAYNFSPADQIVEVADLPMGCQKWVHAAEARGLRWTAWSTARGPIVAWATYDFEGSKRLDAHVLYVEWYVLPNEYHALWCRCDPHRPTEWIFGRGLLEERR